MPRRGRGASRAAAALAAAARRISTPIPPQSDVDEDMLDAPMASQIQSNDEQDAEEAATSPADSDQPDETTNPPTPQDPSTVSRRGRRPGRIPRGRPPDWDTPEPAGEDGSEAGTPRRRGRGRAGWRGGFRGRPRYGPKVVTQATRQAVDKEGNMAEIEDDEAVLPEDPEGETKVDKLGNLLGGRDYRVRVFTIAGRGKRLYMLSTEPARCTGFRDSYLFFNKHLHLVKVIIDDYEKRDLIDRDIIPHSYKGRSIGVVTARSVFREFGARIVVGGRKIIDDYQTLAARARGDVEGEPADPYDRVPASGESYNKNQYVAWHGASSVYHTNLPTVPMPNGKPVFSKRKATITSANWMYEHARAASSFNSQLAMERKRTLGGVYDTHTNMVCYPKIMQPTHARWEPVPPPATSSVSSSKRRLDMVNGVSPHSSIKPDHGSRDNHDSIQAFNGLVRDAQSAALPPPALDTVTALRLDQSTTFPHLSALITRNYLVVDTIFQTPPHASLPPPGPNPHLTHTMTLPELDADDLAELPEECRTALVEAKRVEEEWRGVWKTEENDGWRGGLKIGVGVLAI